MPDGVYGEYLIDLDDKEHAWHNKSIEEFGDDYENEELGIIERAVLAPLLRSSGGNDYSDSGKKTWDL